MELLSVFIILISIGLIVIQIMMIVKFFEIAADIRSIKDTILKHVSTNSVPEHIHKTVSNEKSEIDTDPSNKESNLSNTETQFNGVSDKVFLIILIVAIFVGIVLYLIHLSQK